MGEEGGWAGVWVVGRGGRKVGGRVIVCVGERERGVRGGGDGDGADVV